MLFFYNNTKLVFAVANVTPNLIIQIIFILLHPNSSYIFHNISQIILTRFIANFKNFLDRIKFRESKAARIYCWIANLKKWISWVWIWILCVRLVSWLWILGLESWQVCFIGLVEQIWGAQALPGLGHSGWIMFLKGIDFDGVFPPTCSL